jgi:hypothetical protein
MTIIHASKYLTSYYSAFRLCLLYLFCFHVFHCYIRFCGKVWLKRTSTQSRRRCCQHGRFVADDSPITPLLPLPGEIVDLLLTNQTHFSRTCALYNSILSLGATGVDNGRDVGWERIQGNHAGSRSLLSSLSKLHSLCLSILFPFLFSLPSYSVFEWTNVSLSPQRETQ